MRVVRAPSTLLLLLLTSVSSLVAFPSAMAMRRHHAARQSSLRRWRAQLDHDGAEDLYGWRPHDDEVLADVARKVVSTDRVTLDPDLPNVGTRVISEFVTDDSAEEACYMMPDETSGRTYFMCTTPPDDNENLQCEQQGEGMDWICYADYGI